MKSFKKGKNCKISKMAKIGEDVEIGNNVEISENVHIYGKTKILDNVKIFSGTEISDSIIGKNTEIRQSVIEGAQVGEENVIGPFSRIRNGTKTEKNVKIGNFVEVKNSIIKEGTKASHLAYIGDAEIGKNVNIGCGVIFANYNGKIKQKSVVGDGCFIGSNCNVIAPVKIGNNCYIVAGTTVTDEVLDGDFVIGRVRQENKKDRAKKYLKN